MKQNVRRKLASRSKRPPTDLRLNVIKFDQLRTLYRFTVEVCCDALGLNGHMKLPFYFEQNSLLDHDVSH